MPLAIYTSAAWTANGGIEPAAGAKVEVRSEATGALEMRAISTEVCGYDD